MASPVSFRFESGEISFELTGPEDFVRSNLSWLMPYVQQVVRDEGEAAQAAQKPKEDGAPTELKDWYTQHVPSGTRLTMQDHILVFALWMRSFKKYIFTSESIRRAFAEIGMQEPKSLLQILGTLKRDHNLILGTERRGEYMLNTTGIERARRVLGLPTGGSQREDDDAGEASGDAAARAVFDI